MLRCPRRQGIGTRVGQVPVLVDCMSSRVCSSVLRPWSVSPTAWLKRGGSTWAWAMAECIVGAEVQSQTPGKLNVKKFWLHLAVPTPAGQGASRVLTVFNDKVQDNPPTASSRRSPREVTCKRPRDTVSCCLIGGFSYQSKNRHHALYTDL
ncbi:predicted protein [Plenodomus lingam JN3]|uniref:Predicted protein n=1 Tax=Leptosphaeria maculans (strain JN3 / isolate v23.1.3 / race Av1-4-5-6-7-8) TaxID=985895 RepID=E5R4W4_LEPMJ|nr:predicted protein [Plenodomus lingam JN3]CBX92237.1 predicted protein [Plenodomus lingam JN3]